MINYEEAIARLKTAKDVPHWNEIRDGLKRYLGINGITKIDQSGLIVEVLGRDAVPSYVNV